MHELTSSDGYERYSCPMEEAVWIVIPLRAELDAGREK